VVLPTLNEAGSIKDMVRRVRKANKDYEIYVLDSGSTDGTGSLAAKAGAKVISVPRGKGVAIKAAVAQLHHEVMVMLDSDSSYLPEEIPLFIEKLKSCEVVVGSRFRGKIEPGAMRLTNYIGNLLLTSLANAIYGVPVTDLCSGFWAFRRNAISKMEITAPHFTLEANFYSECAKKRLKLCEVPITYSRRSGQSKLQISDGLKIGAYLVRSRLFSQRSG
jgi:glycosyltransferase involved in cell wall biosynthesis